MPKISVIMPSLNVVPYIRECIDSVICQILEDIEIICVDAGSTDGTCEILEEYASKDSRIRVLKTDRQSYGYQINLGIRAAKGTYIGIVETDDYIAPSMYQSLYSCAVNTNYPDFVRSGFIMFASDGAQKYFWAGDRGLVENGYGRRLDLAKNRKSGVLETSHIWTGIYRRDFFSDKGISLNESAGASYQDISFSLLVGLLADSVAYIKESYYYYRIDNEGSSAKSAAKWKCVNNEFEYVKAEFIKREKYFGEIKKLIQINYLGACFWNTFRLPEKEQNLFLTEIQSVILEYVQNDELYTALSDGEKEWARILSERATLKKYIADCQESKLAMQSLVTLIKKQEKFVLIGAGRLGKRLVSYQQDFGLDFIKAVADNDIGLQGSQWYQYTILSIDIAVKRHCKRRFIVANKLHSDEIVRQLLSLGVQKKYILTFKSMVSENEFAGLFLEKSIHN